MNDMSLDELLDWIDEAEWVSGGSEYDSMSNHEEWRIYSYKGAHYIVYFCNGHPSEKWGDNGYDRDVYCPMPVFPKTETIVREYFVHECGQEAGYYR
jgi:hypothetical protein